MGDDTRVGGRLRSAIKGIQRRGLKIRVSVVRFRPWPPSNSAGYASSSPSFRGVSDRSDNLVTIATRLPSMETTADYLADDFFHPIRQVHIFDTVLPLQGGGVYLGIVIASPLDDSDRSIARLREKERFYFD